ncbi:MAG: large-conductance mechanosensitive channel protein MscL [Tannerellaceae bacterium]|nr:large-conductance mechanosensitive channel protein MscL [Tannerellaceae bacterium]MCD8178757.1 large-conductance mechanosensitive channel protein MscL [Tannerellaceae bacterium]
MGNFFKEFKEFAMRGNVVDLAVGVVIGGAFNNIVNSLVADIIMPAVGLLIGGVNFTGFKIVLRKAQVEGGQIVSPEVDLNYGNFIQVVLNFIIVAFAIFLLVKAINAFHAKKQTDPKPAEVPDDVKLLTEIRDLLKDKPTP